MLPSAPQSCKVYTPAPLAGAMISRLGGDSKLNWLEPCVGYGVFVEELRAVGVHAGKITAVDLDRQPRPQDRLARTIRGTDFLRWCYQTNDRFERIVGNPPFVGINQLPVRLRSSALKVTDPHGMKVPLGANCWYAFLCASLHLLKSGGGLAFVLPAAWDYARYAAPLRNTIHTLFQSVEVHRSRSSIFEDAQEGAVVMVAEGFQSPGELRRIEHSTPQDLIACLGTKTRNKQRTAVSIASDNKRATVRLGDVLDIRIGAVAGDVQYFLLSEQQRQAERLPKESLRPTLSRARHLTASELTESRWQALRDEGERIWLFSPPRRSLTQPSVAAYLELPRAKGGCNRQAFKVQNRNPWYRPPLPGKCDGFMSGMADTGPWICFAAMPGLTATNTLYVVKFRKGMTNRQRYAWALSMLTSTASKSMSQKCRVYAQGLRKYEPGDLADLRVPAPPEIKDARVHYRSAVEALLTEGRKGAELIADRCFGLV
jgi:adenine-specific DNA-methyltransferase